MNDLDLSMTYEHFRHFYSIHRWQYNISYYKPCFSSLYLNSSQDPSHNAFCAMSWNSLEEWLGKFAQMDTQEVASNKVKAWEEPSPRLWLPERSLEIPALHFSSRHSSPLLSSYPTTSSPLLSLAPMLVSHKGKVVTMLFSVSPIRFRYSLSTHSKPQIISSSQAQELYENYRRLFLQEKLRLLLHPFTRKVFSLSATIDHHFLLALRQAFLREPLWLHLKGATLSQKCKQQVSALGYKTHSLPREPMIPLEDLYKDYICSTHKGVYRGKREGDGVCANEVRKS